MNIKRFQLRKDDVQFLKDLIGESNLDKQELELLELLKKERPQLNTSSQCSKIGVLLTFHKFVITDFVEKYGYNKINEFTNRLNKFWDEL